MGQHTGILWAPSSLSTDHSGTHLPELIVPLGCSRLASHPAWNVPEADVGAFRLRPKQIKLVTLLFDPLDLIAVLIYDGDLFREVGMNNQR